MPWPRHLLATVLPSLVVSACGLFGGETDERRATDPGDAAAEASVDAHADVADARGGSGASGGTGATGTAGGSGGAGAMGATGGSAGTDDAGTPDHADADVMDAASGDASTDGDTDPPDARDADAGTGRRDAGLDATPDATADAGPCFDADLDSICDDTDNCPLTDNPTQLDVDGDGIGYACDSWVALPERLWDPSDLSWRLAIAAKGGTVAVQGASLSSSGPRGGSAVVIEGIDVATEIDVATTTLFGPRVFIGDDGHTWLTFGATGARRVFDGVVSSPYAEAVSVYGAPGGGTFALGTSFADVWQDGVATSLITGASGVSPSFFNQVTYLTVSGSGGTQALFAYDAAGNLLSPIAGASDVRVVGGLSGQLFCVADGSGARLELLVGGVPTPGYVAPLPAVDCTDVVQMSVRVGAQRRMNDPDGGLWFRSGSPTGSTYLASPSPTAAPSVLGPSSGVTNDVLAPGAYRHLLVQGPGTSSALLHVDAGALVPLLAAPTPMSAVTRGGRDAFWLWWVDPPAPGTAQSPAELWVAEVDGNVVSGPAQLCPERGSCRDMVLGYEDPTVTVAEVDATGRLWLNVRHGDPAGSAFDLFSVDPAGATKHVPSGGPEVTMVLPASGSGLVGTELGIHVAAPDGTLTEVATEVSAFRTLFSTPDAEGWTWITFEAAPAEWSVGRWQGATFEVVTTGLLAPASGVFGAAGARFISSPSGAGFSLSQVDASGLLPIASGLASAPRVLPRGSTTWVVLDDGTGARVTTVTSATLGPTVLWSNLPARTWGNLLEIGVLVGGVEYVALCELTATGARCTDAGTGERVIQTTLVDPSVPQTVALGLGQDDGRAYVFRDVETVAPDACCTARPTDPLCPSAATNACVCAARPSCCTSGWDATCVDEVVAGCGLCRPGLP